MEGLALLGTSLANLATPTQVLYALGATLAGIVIGLLPGLSATLGIALFTTLTVKMAPAEAILILVCVYVGAIYGGSRTSILLNIPGTAANAAACLDGHVLARTGQAGRAMGIATAGSVAGSLFGVACLAAFTPMLAEVALKFGAFEFFWLGLVGVMLSGGLTGADAIKGWLMGLLGLFVATMLIVGRRLIPWMLHYVAHTGSRELFRLAVLAIAIGVAFGAAKLFDVSFALGAFFAGMILAESPLSHQAARETLPLRDAFAVLFFVSVGMLFDPGTLLRDPLPLLATIAIIILGKSVAAYWIVRAFGHSHAKALTISASLAQIGEFSFILAVLGVELGVLPEEGRDLIVAGAILSILANPFIFQALDRHLGPDPDGEKAAAAAVAPVEPPPQAVSKPPVLLVGHGRVGAKISQALLEHGHALTVIDDNAEALDALSETKATRHGAGFASFTEEMGENMRDFGWILIAIPDPFEAGSMVETARRLAPNSRIIARAHSEEAVAHLRGLGADDVLMAEHEVALAMIRVVDGRVIA